MIIYVYICTCMLDAYITHVPRSHCTYVIHFRVTRMYGTLRIEASKARQGKEVVSSQPACWLSSRIDKPSTDEWINKRKKKKRKRRKEKNDGHASTWPRRIVHHWLRCPIKGQRASNDNNHLNRVCSPIDVSIDKSYVHFVYVIEPYFDEFTLCGIRSNSSSLYDEKCDLTIRSSILDLERLKKISVTRKYLSFLLRGQNRAVNCESEWKSILFTWRI